MGHSRHASATTFPHFPYSRRVMIVLRRSLYGVVSVRRVLAFSFHCRQQFDRISPGSKHFVGRGCWPNLVSQCCVHRVSLTVPKHLDSCSTFHKANVTSRALSLPFVSRFEVLEPSQFHTPNVGSGFSETADVSWRCFPGHSALLPIRRVLSPRKS